jgi:GntR family transcriptional regulator
VDPTLPVPIWSQIEEAVRYLVASGALRPGDALPSVRDLAREQQINPNTVAKAYQRLAEAGFLETRRGEGTFVAERPPAMPAAERARLIREGATRLATLAVNLGSTRSEAIAALQAAWDEPTSKGGRR